VLQLYLSKDLFLTLKLGLADRFLSLELGCLLRGDRGNIILAGNLDHVDGDGLDRDGLDLVLRILLRAGDGFGDSIAETLLDVLDAGDGDGVSEGIVVGELAWVCIRELGLYDIQKDRIRNGIRDEENLVFTFEDEFQWITGNGTLVLLLKFAELSFGSHLALHNRGELLFLLQRLFRLRRGVVQDLVVFDRFLELPDGLQGLSTTGPSLEEIGVELQRERERAGWVGEKCWY